MILFISVVSINVSPVQCNKYDIPYQYNEWQKTILAILIDAKKAFDKIQGPFTIKNSEQIRHRNYIYQVIKAIYNKPMANTVMNVEQLQAFFPRSGTRQRSSFITFTQHGKF
jgi:hypothetical protein